MHTPFAQNVAVQWKKMAKPIIALPEFKSTNAMTVVIAEHWRGRSEDHALLVFVVMKTAPKRCESRDCVNTTTKNSGARPTDWQGVGIGYKIEWE